MQVIFLTGYPGSGKGTQGKVLSQVLGIPHISTGELFRNEAKTGSKIGNIMKRYMDKGQIIPNDIHFDYLSSKLRQFPNGYILDGYPKNRECLDFILKEIDGCCIPTVIYLTITRETALARLSNRLFCENCEISFPKTENICNKCNNTLIIRHDDTEEIIKKRLNVFEESTVQLFDIYTEMGIFNTIYGEQTQERVLFEILMNLFPQAAYAEISSVFHNHIDAQNKALVLKINQNIDNILGLGACKSKIYSVEHLVLSSQIDQMQDIYSQMPNFKNIENSESEAFSTCKMGTYFNQEQQLVTLDIASQYPNQGVMTEVEEELIKYDLVSSGPIFTLIRQCIPTINWSEFSQYRNIVKNKLFELHHGFEFPKTSNQIPIALKLLSKLTSDFGFKNGGWFIFKDPTRWLYRSNEFSNSSYTDCLLILMKQSVILHNLLNLIHKDPEVVISSSLERVHAIWPIDRKIFVNSSNQDKLDEYRKYLTDYEVVGSTIEPDEPDADSITIIRYKTSKLPVSYIADDVSLDVEGEDIGTNVKWHVKNKGLDKHIGKYAVFNCFIGIKTDDSKIKVYKGSVPGKLVSPVGNGFGFGPYFLPDGADTTLGEIMSDQHNARYLAIQNYLNNEVHVVEPLLTEWNDKFQ